MNQLLSPTPFADVNIVLHHFLTHIQALLADHFQGMYLVGSLALGDFNPDSSDIDFVVVTDTDIEDVCFDALQAMHAQFAASNSPWAGKIEAIYVPASILYHAGANAAAVDAARYPQIERGLSLVKAPLESGWVFQCLTIRDRGVVVAGRDPHTLVDFIDPQVCHIAAAAITGGWIEQAENDPLWMPWLRQRDAQTFIILTLCRLHYSLATGSVASKPSAAEWARRIIGDPWASLIERTLAGQHEVGNISPGEEAETLAFIQFTFEQSKHACMMANRVINQGDIYWIQPDYIPEAEPGDYAHPYVVIQDDLFNHSRIHTVVVCALTTNRKQAHMPGNVLLEAGEANLPRPSAIVVSKISTVQKSQLGDYIGALNEQRIHQILAGIRFLQSSFSPRKRNTEMTDKAD